MPKIDMHNYRFSRLLAIVSCICLPQALAANAVGDVAWAVNVGGPAYEARDGTVFEAENSVKGGETGTLETILGSQDPDLYQTYRAGEVQIDRPVEPGTYALTFHFAEPLEINAGDRLFDVVVEDQTVIEDVDVILWRDGKTKSALTVTVRDVEVADGELNVRLVSGTRDPVISGLVVVRTFDVSDDWELAWSDEFDVPGAPDPALWSVDVWPPRTVNDEDQTYTDRPKNLRVEDGFLVIEAHKEKFAGAEYTSARIHSSGKGDFLYGRVEARALVPVGKGTWSAIWMLPSDPFKYATTCQTGDLWQGVDECDAWPNSGEIDILEHVGYQPGHIHGTVHNVAYYWRNWQQRKGRILQDGIGERFHVYAMEWTPERIDIFVDDVRYFTYFNEQEGWESWPYDHAFHLVINLAIGGGWGRAGGGIDDTVFPQKMLVDYVRVYKRASADGP